MIKKFLNKLAKQIIKLRYLIIFVWSLLIIIGLTFGLNLSDKLVGGGWDAVGSNSSVASELIDANFQTRDSSTLTLVYKNSEHHVTTIEYQNSLIEIINYLIDQEEIIGVSSILDNPNHINEELIGSDGHTTISTVYFGIEEDEAIKVIPEIQRGLVKLVGDNNKATLLGLSALWAETSELSQQGIAKAQIYAFPIILLVLILVFRTVVSAIVPLVVGVAAILVSLGVLYFTADYTSLSMFVMDSAMMVGLGVGIDFSLIFVMRFKEELEKNKDVKSAIIKTMETSGRAILFSGIIIAVAMSTLFIVDIKSVKSIALGIILVVLVLILVSLTLLPALLSFIGHNINKLKISFLKKRKESKVWYHWAKSIMKRPIIYLAIGIGIHLVLTIPATDLKMATPDARMLPANSLVREGVDVIGDNFGVGFASPINVVLKSDNDKIIEDTNIGLISKFTLELSELETVEAVNSFLRFIPNNYSLEEMLLDNNEMFTETLNHYLNESLNVSIVEVIPKYPAGTEETKELVNEIRNNYSSMLKAAGIDVFVGGETAAGMDGDKVMYDSLVPVIITTLILIFIILLITFRSIFVPLKAIIMNVFSLGATYGILVLLFQTEVGTYLGIEVSGFIQSFIPVLLLSLLFSLSTDYEVFLLNRVKEEYDKSHNNEESVALGLTKTAPMITGAAIMMICVFLSFAFAGIHPIQQLGLGMAIGIFIDATFIRLLIVPTSMKLMGKWNWWFPKIFKK